MTVNIQGSAALLASSKANSEKEPEQVTVSIVTEELDTAYTEGFDSEKAKQKLLHEQDRIYDQDGYRYGHDVNKSEDGKIVMTPLEVYIEERLSRRSLALAPYTRERIIEYTHLTPAFLELDDNLEKEILKYSKERCAELLMNVVLQDGLSLSTATQLEFGLVRDAAGPGKEWRFLTGTVVTSTDDGTEISTSYEEFDLKGKLLKKYTSQNASCNSWQRIVRKLMVRRDDTYFLDFPPPPEKKEKGTDDSQKILAALQPEDALLSTLRALKITKLELTFESVKAPESCVSM